MFSLVEPIKKKVLAHQDQHFWIFHPWINFESYFNNQLPNLTITNYADEIWTQGDRARYTSIGHQIDKNFNSDKHWISLGNNRRVARYLAAMYLLGMGVASKGLLKIDPTEILENDSWESYLSYWRFNHRSEIFTIESSFPILKNGFYKIKNKVDYEARIYQGVPLVNHENFDKFLRTIYRDSFVEIVNETMFMEPVGVISEKILNSIYGCNLPIILGVHNTVKRLRDIGFDMFDDVIDHSYDTIADPLPRMVMALDSNKRLLQDGEFAKDMWIKCKHRLENNVMLAKQKELEFPSVVTNLLTSLNSTFKQI